jgi:hypothetical protein
VVQASRLLGLTKQGWQAGRLHHNGACRESFRLFLRDA